MIVTVTIIATGCAAIQLKQEAKSVKLDRQETPIFDISTIFSKKVYPTKISCDKNLTYPTVIDKEGLDRRID